MAKTRKPAMTNTEVLDKLIKSGAYTPRPSTDPIKDDSFSKIFDKHQKPNPAWRKLYDNLGWMKLEDLRRASPSSVPDRYVTVYEYDYKIPIHIYREHVVKRFKPKFEVGSMVRINQRTNRKNTRNPYNTSIGNSQEFKHLGIGSGKQYLSEDMIDAIVNFSTRNSWSSTYFIRSLENRLLIGNQKYCPNIMGSINKAKAYRAKGIVKQERWNKEIVPRDFIENIVIKGDGVFGPRKLINGYITEVYVHFLYPRWERKREARYFVQLESGAGGIFTDDYLTRVYDEDFSVTDTFMKPCPVAKTGEGCLMIDMCTHSIIHEENHECSCICPVSEMSCDTMLKYENFFDTTHGMAKDLIEEK